MKFSRTLKIPEGYEELELSLSLLLKEMKEKKKSKILYLNISYGDCLAHRDKSLEIFWRDDSDDEDPK